MIEIFKIIENKTKKNPKNIYKTLEGWNNLMDNTLY